MKNKITYIPNDALKVALEDLEDELKSLKRYKKIDLEKCTMLDIDSMFYNLTGLLTSDNLAYLLKEVKEIIKKTEKFNNMD